MTRNFDYPPARRGDVVDVYHGVNVADPYRWLEDQDSAETAAFITAQTSLARHFLDAIPQRAAYAARLAALWNYDRLTAPPERHGPWYFFWQQSGLQPQPVLYRQAGLDGAPSAVLDPNTFSADGTVAVTTWSFSPDGRRLAYTITRGGSDWQELHIHDLEHAQAYPEVIPFVRFAQAAWAPDGAGFYYSGFDDPARRDPADANRFNKLFWHTLGTPAEADRLVYERPDAPDLNFPPTITTDNAYLVLRVWHGAINRNRLYYRRLADDGPFIRLLDEADASYDLIDSHGSELYILTDKDAPNGRVAAIDLNRPQPENWRTVIPEQPEALDSAYLVGDYLALVYLRDAAHEIRLADRQGAWLGELSLPGIATLFGAWGRPATSDFFVLYHSFLTPPTALHADLAADRHLAPFRPATLDFDAAAYETRRVFVPGDDGARIPLFITHRRGLKLDGSHPTILYGYGGFSINVTPAFNVGRLAWLEQGGVFAQAALRGGAEYGELWHQAGMLERKQNVFDDFMACARYLIDAGYTRTRRLAIEGRSNGGLLTAACLTQRPDLFGAVISHVPVIDMLRYHLFTAGRYWTPEYGCAADPEQFPFLLAYSPLHNIRAGQTYPPTLILTAARDDRVMPLHAQKFAAALQAADAGVNPILLRFEEQAGHGFGKPTAKLIAEAADVYAFLSQTLA